MRCREGKAESGMALAEEFDKKGKGARVKKTKKVDHKAMAVS